MPQRGVAKRIKARLIPVAEPLEGRPLLSLGFASFAIPGANARVTSMTRGPDGNLWFTQVIGPALFTQSRLEIGRLTPSGAVTLFDVPSDNPAQSVSASGIVAGPGGKLYFTEEVTHINWFNPAQPSPLASKVGAITTSGAVTETDLPAGINFNDVQGDIANGPGGVWFTASQTNPDHSIRGYIGRFNETGLTFFPIATPGATPGAITLGPSGDLWFVDTTFVWVNTPMFPGDYFITGTNVGRISATGHVTELPIASGDGTRVSAITPGSDGNVWFSASTVLSNGESLGEIDRMTPSGKLMVFPIMEPLVLSGVPFGITLGADGAVWFSGGPLLGRLTPSGAFSFAVTPLGSSAITLGPGSQLFLAFTTGGLNSAAVIQEVLTKPVDTPVKLAVASFTVVEGTSIQQAPIATFAGPGSASDYAANVYWSNGQWTGAEVVSSGPGKFVIKASSGNFPTAGKLRELVEVYHVKLSNGVGGGVTIAENQVSVTDAPLKLLSVAFDVPAPSVVRVIASFIDTDPGSPTSTRVVSMNGLPYQAFLNWGDGSQPTPLTVGFVTEGIAPNLTSFLTVTGLASHKFAHSGAHLVTLTIRDIKSSDPAFQATLNAYVVLHS